MTRLIWKFNLCAIMSSLRVVTSKFLQPDKHRNTKLNEILFYGDKDEEKRKQVGANNLFCIYYVLIHASKSIDVCMPSLVSDTIAKCLISVKRKNVRVRVIIHDSNDFHNLQSFDQNGIEVKVIKPELLEHEFILIDACGELDAVAVVGSLDYETTRVNCNRDNTLLTSDETVVKTLKNEFDRVWSPSSDSHRRNNKIKFSN